MNELFAGWPFWAVFAVLFVGAMARGQLVYWLARSLTGVGLRDARSGWRGRMARWLDGDGVRRGSDVLRRVGLVAVPLCYVTVGLQSAVLAAAGVLRIPAPRFTLATIPGAVAWATIYSTIGWALWEATILGLAGSPWALAFVTALLVALAVALRLRRRACR